MNKIKNIILFKLCLILVWSIRSILCRPLVDPMQHDLQIVNAKTFTTNVQLARQTNVVGAFFYSSSDSDVRSTISELNSVSKDLKGIVNVVAVNCGDPSLRNVCKSELGEEYTTPSFRVYPKIPLPPVNYTKKLLKDDLKKELLKYLPSSVEKIEPGMVAHFMTKQEILPKVLLFSDKEHPSYVYKALSNAFNKKLVLGFVDVNKHPDLKEEYKVTKVPTMLILKHNERPQKYKGEFKYLPMFEWLNVSSEAFLLGGGYSDSHPSKAKPWKFEKIPKLNFFSHQDICFNKNHGLCVIYLTNGEIKDEEKDMLNKLSQDFKSELYGKWMWMDLSEETGFAELFKDVKVLPSLAVFNPKNKLRYFLHDGEKSVTKHSIEKMMEKILGGDARFTHVKGDLPKFVVDLEPKKEEL